MISPDLFLSADVVANVATGVSGESIVLIIANSVAILLNIGLLIHMIRNN